MSLYPHSTTLVQVLRYVVPPDLEYCLAHYEAFTERAVVSLGRYGLEIAFPSHVINRGMRGDVESFAAYVQHELERYIPAARDCGYVGDYFGLADRGRRVRAEVGSYLSALGSE